MYDEAPASYEHLRIIGVRVSHRSYIPSFIVVIRTIIDAPEVASMSYLVDDSYVNLDVLDGLEVMSVVGMSRELLYHSAAHAQSSDSG